MFHFIYNKIHERKWMWGGGGGGGGGGVLVAGLNKALGNLTKTVSILQRDSLHTKRC